MIDEESMARVLSGIEFHLSHLEAVLEPVPLHLLLPIQDRFRLLQGFLEGVRTGLQIPREKDDG